MVPAARRAYGRLMPSSRRALLLVPAALAAVVLAGCDLGDDGPRTSQTRDVGAFTRIDNSDSVDVRLRVGEAQHVRVRAGEKVIDDVVTEVRDGTLHLTFDHDGFGPSEVVVEASVPRLEGIDASGSGDIDADGIKADALEVRSEGSSDITVAGTAGRLALDLTGSGDADLAGLAARDARVTVRGSGDVDVRADDRLEVDVDGSGDVRYHGAPALTQHVDGSGELTRAR
jgi:Putative auto-transporter adhesin, head GIN domain